MLHRYGLEYKYNNTNTSSIEKKKQHEKREKKTQKQKLANKDPQKIFSNLEIIREAGSTSSYREKKKKETR